jgi:hypothetical protein
VSYQNLDLEGVGSARPTFPGVKKRPNFQNIGSPDPPIAF